VCINIRPPDDPKKPNEPYCNIKPEKLEEFGWKKIRFEDWEAQDDNTIFLIDECHYDLPVRSTKVPPPHIQRLTEHRSRGFDFFLLTQHPKNIDSFVRNLVQAPGWHEHIKRLGGALPVANFHQWDAVNIQCEKFGSAKDANSKTRPYPTEVYTWYESATIHTGRKRIPWRVWFILAAVVLIPYLFYSGFSQIGKGTVAKQSSSKADPARGGSAAAGGGAAANQVKTPAEYVASYQPRVPGLMHSAPAYDGLTTPKRVPVPAACVEMPSKGCKCYTQDATPYPVELAMCRQIVAHGVFLAFQAEGELAGRNQVQQQPVKAQEPVQAASSAPLGLVLIGGGIPTAPNPPAAAPAPATQARVQPGSKWSFTTGG
jgi:zona occludens toxin